MLRRMFAMAAVLVGGAFSLAQQPAAPAEPAKLLEKQPYVLGPAHMQEYPEQDYFFVSTEATQKTMPEVMKSLIPHLAEAAKAAGITPPTSPLLIVTNGLSPLPDAPFEVEAGFVVTPETKPAGDAQVRKLEAFNCASMLYTGTPQELGKAFESLFMTVMAAGKTPTMAVRQMVLYYAGDESENNVMMLMVEVK